MTGLIYVSIYAAVLTFGVACIVRAALYARLPLHLRWDLYPVPHESPGRVRHGGSYYEITDWWTQPRKSHRLLELRFMALEVLFLHGLWKFNRRLWFVSFPFHMGIYLLICTLVLVGFGAALACISPAWMAGFAGNVVHGGYPALGITGSVLTMAGAVGLMIRRLRDPGLRNYTTPGDIFNLLFFVVAVGTLSSGCLWRDAGAPDLTAICRGLFAFDLGLHVPGLLSAGLLLSALLAAYVPMTHMSHFIGKFFTYHSVRWDDAPNRGEPALQVRLAECLAYRPTWAAPHIGADGKRTWAQIASTRPVTGEKR